MSHSALLHEISHGGPNQRAEAQAPTAALEAAGLSAALCKRTCGRTARISLATSSQLSAAWEAGWERRSLSRCVGSGRRQLAGSGGGSGRCRVSGALCSAQGPLAAHLN